MTSTLPEAVAPQKKKGIFRFIKKDKKSKNEPTPASTPAVSATPATPATDKLSKAVPASKITRAATINHHIRTPHPAIGTSESHQPSNKPGSKPHLPPSVVRRASTNIRPTPFTKETTPFMGLGNEIAGARNVPSLASPNFGHASPNLNPTSHSINNVSRNPSMYSLINGHTNGTVGSVEDEKKNILPLPILDPNDFLDQRHRQIASTLTDMFTFPDKASGKEKNWGTGASASVVSVIEKKTGKVFALKRVLLFPGETPQAFYPRTIKEFKIASKLSDCKFVVSTHFCLKIPSSTTMTRGWGILMELCKLGDVFSMVLKPSFKPCPIAEKFCLFKQIALGVKFMHDRGYVHRDLKPENVLLDDHGCCKITDFGVADFAYDMPEEEFDALECFLNPDHEHLDSDDSSAEAGVQYHNGFPIKMSKSFVGSAPYCPPEVMACKDSKTAAYYNPFKFDTWSLGMILFCLIYQNTPFHSASSSDPAYTEYVNMYKSFVSSHPQFRSSERISGPGIEYRFGKEFQNGGASRVAFRLVDPNPDTRYSIDDLMNDPWFIGIECCQEESSVHGAIHRSNSIMSSHQANSSSSNLKHASATTSPIIKPKSMLDIGTESLANTSIASSSPVTETSENPFTKKDLPTLAEDNDEDQTNIAKPTSPASVVPNSTLRSRQSTLSKHEPIIASHSSMCDFGGADLPAHVAAAVPSSMVAPTPAAYASNILNNNMMSLSNQSIHSTTDHSAGHHQHHHDEISGSNHSINGAVSSDGNSTSMYRASSITSLSSMRSSSTNNLRSGSTGSINGSGRRIKHHHVEIASSISSMKRS
ncbi:hypothetical protein WICPIJ_003791 [Wickerhamomyces pijperi]|uniref:Protein kinase domain-containing protein n=1 Tax=Wickerhamomyces pijperi TaxID=599730 RepID=A0A9P8Q6I0_WICPI|nr:hypothetical protein WICPIJ_003791 [Wickerhamomyces pijperi]